MKRNHLYFLLFLFMFASCSVTERRYMPGYYVEHNTSAVEKKLIPIKQPIASPERLTTIPINTIKQEEPQHAVNVLQTETQAVVKHQKALASATVLPQPRKSSLVQESVFPSDSLNHTEPAKTKRVNAGLTVLYAFLGMFCAFLGVILIIGMGLSGGLKAMSPGWLTANQYNQEVTDQWILVVVLAFASVLFLNFCFSKAAKILQDRDSTKSQKATAEAGKIVGFIFLAVTLAIIIAAIV